jgi:pilus assembly protein CpaE
MITLSMAVEDKSLWSEVHSCLQDESVQIDSEQEQVGDLGAFLSTVQRSKPDLVLIDVSVLHQTLQEVIAKLRSAAPRSMIVALNTTGVTGPVLECFRAGVDEYLFPPLAEGLKRALERGRKERRKSDSGKPEGKTIAFLSAKGGCGATTLACHVAVELSRLNQTPDAVDRRRHVLLADLDVSAGMVAFLMKSASPYSIVDALSNVHRLDASYWKALVSNGIPGLEVISAPNSMGARQEPKAEEIRHVLEFARKQYEWTVADAGRGIGESTMTAMESADQTCVVTTPEIPALQQTRQILQRLLDGGYKQERIRLIVNRVPKRSGIRPEELPKMLGIPLYAAFPECYAELHEAYSQGQLLRPGTVLGEYMGRLARKLAGAEEPKAKRKIPFFG